MQSAFSLGWFIVTHAGKFHFQRKNKRSPDLRFQYYPNRAPNFLLHFAKIFYVVCPPPPVRGLSRRLKCVMFSLLFHGQKQKRQ